MSACMCEPARARPLGRTGVPRTADSRQGWTGRGRPTAAWVSPAAGLTLRRGWKGGSPGCCVGKSSCRANPLGRCASWAGSPPDSPRSPAGAPAGLIRRPSDSPWSPAAASAAW
eukprot:15460264-Alexandrium_andersonii.AAC.1